MLIFFICSFHLHRIVFSPLHATKVSNSTKRAISITSAAFFHENKTTMQCKIENIKNLIESSFHIVHMVKCDVFMCSVQSEKWNKPEWTDTKPNWKWNSSKKRENLLTCKLHFCCTHSTAQRFWYICSMYHVLCSRWVIAMWAGMLCYLLRLLASLCCSVFISNFHTSSFRCNTEIRFANEIGRFQYTSENIVLYAMDQQTVPRKRINPIWLYKLVALNFSCSAFANAIFFSWHTIFFLRRMIHTIISTPPRHNRIKYYKLPIKKLSSVKLIGILMWHNIFSMDTAAIHPPIRIHIKLYFTQWTNEIV